MTIDLTRTPPAATPTRLAVADDYYRVTLGLENALRDVAVHAPPREQRTILGHLLAAIPDAERGMLVDRIADLADCWSHAHFVGDEDAMEAASAELYRVCQATAQLVAVESADAVTRYRAVFEPAGGVA